MSSYTRSKRGRPKLAELASLVTLCLERGRQGRWLSDDSSAVALGDLANGSSLERPLETFRGRSVLIATVGPLAAALAAISLDGIARRILLATPDLSPAHLPGIAQQAEADAVVTDGQFPGLDALGLPIADAFSTLPTVGGPAPVRDVATEWVLFTSGTTGAPKMVLHTLPTLTGPLDDGLAVPTQAIWSTFYDVRRYGGLTILFRALLGGGSMVLSVAGEPLPGFLRRAGKRGVTHISGTPSHWRRVLMSGQAHAMAPGYVRLSGEVADQTILDQLAEAYPGANVAHAFASTEAGFAFDVRDGLAGFPAALVQPRGDLRVVDGTLRIRSGRTAARYLGDAAPVLLDADGFVDTGDMVELQGDRYLFFGRREGVINVGGQKVFPEEVEAVLNRHPAVRLSRVWARHSPITGAVVAADIVLWQLPADGFAPLNEAILSACRAALPPHKVPVRLRAVESLQMTASGKLARSHV